MNTQRTAGPWSDSGMTGEEGCVYANGEVLVAECSNPEDAQFIVRACNAHDNLLAFAEKIASKSTFGGDTININVSVWNEMVLAARDVLNEHQK
jgi:hypothetical protein